MSTTLGQPDNTASASVVGNTLMAFTNSMEAEQKTNLLYLLGYAQLQAVQNFGHDPKVDPSGYYGSVGDMLEQVGIEKPYLDFKPHPTSASTLQPDQVVLEVLSDTVPSDELAVVKASLAALRTTSTDSAGPWSIVTGHAVSATTGGFSVALADQRMGPDGTKSLTVNLGAFLVSGSIPPKDFLWTASPSASFAMQVASASFTVPDDFWYQPGVRETIVQAMQSHSAGYIAELPALHVTA
ncbi:MULTISPECIES: hypothetical protein [unclassified Nocardioides]|uniref:hypothetical protein n=1 Tax=unclassified Nocardioides TaxID=2615069 RepID=UPI000AB64A74|nr:MULTISPECIES: hypothetical protein [unclassified Nocardioides]